MNEAYAALVFLLLVSAPWIIRALHARSRRLGNRSAEGELDKLLMIAEKQILVGEIDAAVPVLQQAAPLLERCGDAVSSGRAARLHLCEGLIALAQAPPEKAAESFLAAKKLAESVADKRLRDTLRTRAMAELALMTVPIETFRQSAEVILTLEPDVADPSTCAQIAWVALRLGSIEQEEGRWKKARHAWEESIRIAQRVPAPDGPGRLPAPPEQVAPWADSRSAAARSALEVGKVLFSANRRDEARDWFERAMGVLEGPDHAMALENRALVCLVWSNHMEDSLTEAIDRRSLLERSVAAGLQAQSEGGTWYATEAEFLLGQISLEAGDFERALRLFESTLSRIPDTATGPPRRLGVRARIMIAETHAARESWEPAVAALRRALESSRDDPDPECRDLALEVLHKLHTCVSNLGRKDEGRDLVDQLEAQILGFSPGARRCAAVIHVHLLGLQSMADERWSAADEHLRRVESSARSEEGAWARYWERQATLHRGLIALRDTRPKDALDHFERALAIHVGRRSAGEEREQRAAIRMHLAECQVALDQLDRVEATLRRCAEDGVASGRSQGRYLAALASFRMAESPLCTSDDRRRFLEAAVRLGKLSGSEVGRALAQKAEREQA